MGLCLFVFLSGPLFSSPPDEAQRLVERMSVAATTRTYDGVFVYRRGDRSDTMRIIHRADAEGTVERLVSLSGNAREVIRNGEQVICIYPERRIVIVEQGHGNKMLPNSFSQPLARIADHYEFRLVGKDRIADRTTAIVSVQPLKPTRYGYKFWIDEESGLLLKSAVLGVDGRQLEGILFTQIELPENISDEALEPDMSSGGFTWITQEHLSVPPVTGTAEHWEVGWLPAGFRMDGHTVQAFAASPMPVDHMVFSDGLAMVSVFVEKHTGVGEQLNGFTARGAVNAYSRAVGDFQVTVVGEVPSMTLQQIAGSVTKSNTSDESRLHQLPSPGR